VEDIRYSIEIPQKQKGKQAAGVGAYSIESSIRSPAPAQLASLHRESGFGFVIAVRTLPEGGSTIHTPQNHVQDYTLVEKLKSTRLILCSNASSRSAAFKPFCVRVIGG